MLLSGIVVSDRPGLVPEMPGNYNLQDIGITLKIREQQVKSGLVTIEDTLDFRVYLLVGHSPS